MTNEEIDRIADRMAIRVNNMPQSTTTCEVCGKLPEHPGNGYIMPYASAYDGAYVCEHCLVKAVDTKIAKVRANQ